MLFTEITNEDKTETLVREYYPSEEDKNKIGKLMKEYTISTKNGKKMVNLKVGIQMVIFQNKNITKMILLKELINCGITVEM